MRKRRREEKKKREKSRSRPKKTILKKHQETSKTRKERDRIKGTRGESNSFGSLSLLHALAGTARASLSKAEEKKGGRVFFLVAFRT